MKMLGEKRLAEIRAEADNKPAVLRARAQAFMAVTDLMSKKHIELAKEWRDITPTQLETDKYLQGYTDGRNSMLEEISEITNTLTEATMTVFNKYADRMIRKAEEE